MSEHKPRILFVDDDSSLRKIFTKYLEEAGYVVALAVDGQEALEQVRQEPPALIVLDVMLPKMNGYEVCATLKRDPATRPIPIIMYTAKGQPREHFVGFMFGADAYLGKPASAKELLQHIARLLAGSSPSDVPAG